MGYGPVALLFRTGAVQASRGLDPWWIGGPSWSTKKEGGVDGQLAPFRPIGR